MVQALEKDQKLSSKTLKQLKETGQSRFPVYAQALDNITGILYLYELAGVDVSEKTAGDMAKDSFFFVNGSQKLDHALNAFLRTKHHIFIVINKFTEVIGVVTMEDILEEIIGTEIVDEFDKYGDLRSVAAKIGKTKSETVNKV